MLYLSRRQSPLLVRYFLLAEPVFYYLKRNLRSLFGPSLFVNVITLVLQTHIYSPGMTHEPEVADASI